MGKKLYRVDVQYQEGEKTEYFDNVENFVNWVVQSQEGFWSFEGTIAGKKVEGVRNFNTGKLQLWVDGVSHLLFNLQYDLPTIFNVNLN